MLYTLPWTQLNDTLYVNYIYPMLSADSRFYLASYR